MENDQFLIDAFDFVAKTQIFYRESVFDWCQKMSRLYERGWLYGCFRGTKLIALAGAYRIPEWDEKWLHEIPEEEEGTRLFIPFFISESDQITDPIKLLRRYLNRHPQVEEILYCEKYRRWDRQPRIKVRKRRVLRLASNRFCEERSYRTRVGIQPPDLIPLREAAPALGLRDE